MSLLDEIRAFYGDTVHTSDWLTVDQGRIDQFARATLDLDWLHVDPDRAARDGPFGGTIAQGFWTLSLLTHLQRQMTGHDYPAGVAYGFNYGFDRIRWISPVRVGKRVRGTCRLVDVVDRGGGRYLVKTENRVEIEGEEKPAMLAEWLVLLVAGEQ